MSESVLALAQELIRCGPSPAGDEAAQQIVADFLAQFRPTVEKFSDGPVQNLWIELGSRGPLFVFAGHTDVVPAGELTAWTVPPFEGRIQEGKLFGRGASDMRGAVAAFAAASKRFLVTRGSGGVADPGYRIGILIAGDEETGPEARGTERLIAALAKRGKNIDACIVGEPTARVRLGDSIKIGRRGSLTGTVTVIGKQGHSAYPHLADNPIHKSALILERLTKIEWPRPDDPWPATTLQVTNIRAGEGATNVIPGTLRFTFNVRYSGNLARKDVIAHCEQALTADDTKLEIVWGKDAAPFITRNAQFTEFVRAAVARSTGKEPILTCEGGTSDARFFFAQGIPVAEVGPCGATIHQADECIDCAELGDLVDCYLELLEQFGRNVAAKEI